MACPSCTRLPGGTRTKSAYELLYARQSLVTHAKAFGLDAIDLVDIDYKGIRMVYLVCVLKFYVVLYNDLYQSCRIYYQRFY